MKKTNYESIPEGTKVSVNVGSFNGEGTVEALLPYGHPYPTRPGKEPDYQYIVRMSNGRRKTIHHQSLTVKGEWC